MLPVGPDCAVDDVVLDRVSMDTDAEVVDVAIRDTVVACVGSEVEALLRPVGSAVAETSWPAITHLDQEQRKEGVDGVKRNGPGLSDGDAKVRELDLRLARQSDKEPVPVYRSCEKGAVVGN